MADYKRMVSYMYQYENGIKGKNVGFARVEARGGQCKITLHMQLLGQLDSIFPTYLIQRGDNNMDLVYIGDSVLRSQVMDSRLSADENNIAGTGYKLSDMGGLLLFLNDNVFFATEWDDKPVVAQEVLEALRPKTNRQAVAKKRETPGKFQEELNVSQKEQQELEAELNTPRYKLPGGWKMIERLRYLAEQQKENEAREVMNDKVIVDPLDRAVAEPVKADPIAAKPVVAEPVKVQPIAAKPLVTEPVKAEPIYADPLQGIEEVNGTNKGNSIWNMEDKNKVNLYNQFLNLINQDKFYKIIEEFSVAQLNEEKEQIHNAPVENQFEGDQFLEQSQYPAEQEQSGYSVPSEYRNDSPQNYDYNNVNQPELEYINDVQPEFEYINDVQPEFEYINDVQPEFEYSNDENPSQYGNYNEDIPQQNLNNNVEMEPELNQYDIPQSEIKDEEDQQSFQEFNETGYRQEIREQETFGRGWEGDNRGDGNQNCFQDNSNAADPQTARNFLENYPRIYPFEDNEILQCVKIEPKDIGLLPKEVWPLSNNSFLMHGFYCYHHLIFAKMKSKIGFSYILGVPGIYHGREKFMAKMFGFESFKSIRKRELKQGDFGYWYIPLYV